MSTNVSISVNPDASDMVVIDLGSVDLGAGTFRLASVFR